MQIGLLGGSFNPIHVGHLILAENAREALGLEYVVFIPAGHPPHKPDADLAPAGDRLRMVELATAGNPDFRISELELHRDGPSYTIDTVRAMRELLGPEAEIVFLIGADTLGELPTWHRIDELVRTCRFAVAARPGEKADGGARLDAAIGADRADDLRRSRVEMPLVAVSASDIRRRVRDGRSIRYLVPDDVCKYIVESGLYAERR